MVGVQKSGAGSGAMTRSYAAKRLLEHGALTFADFLVITGWRKGIANNVLRKLREWQVACVVNIDGRRHYALTSDNEK